MTIIQNIEDKALKGLVKKFTKMHEWDLVEDTLNIWGFLLEDREQADDFHTEEKRLFDARQILLGAGWSTTEVDECSDEELFEYSREIEEERD